MPSRLKFSHKILLAASLVVIATFSLFTLYNDYPVSYTHLTLPTIYSV